MSFKATFKFDGGNDDGYDVLSCNYSFNQAVDQKGQVASIVRGGNISVQVEASDDDSIVEWMIDPFKKVNGSITFMKLDQDSTMKEVSFEDGYCVQYSEVFNSSNNSPMLLSLTISAKKITVGTATHENA